MLSARRRPLGFQQNCKRPFISYAAEQRACYLGAAAAVCTLLLGCGSSNPESERKHLPTGLEVGKVVSGSVERTLTYEKGLIIFELPDNVAAKIEQKGISALNDISKDGKKSISTYKNWEETPVISLSKGYAYTYTGETIHPVREFYCGGTPGEPWNEDNSLCKALVSPGGYYALGSDAEITLVLPDQRLVVYAISNQ